MLLGPLVSGVLLAVSSPGTVLIATGVAYALSSLTLARIPGWTPLIRQHATDAPADGFIGVRAIRDDPWVRLVVGLYCAENLVTGTLNVLVVVAALQLLKLGNSGVGIPNATIGAGGVARAVAVAALATFHSKKRDPRSWHRVQPGSS